MRENYRKPIASKEKFPQFITMNVIDGQAGLARYSSLIFYSLTINNILNIIILVILAAVSIRAVTNMGIVGHAINGTQQYAEQAKAENAMLDETATKLEDAVAKVKEIQGGSNNNTGNTDTEAPDLLKDYVLGAEVNGVRLGRDEEEIFDYDNKVFKNDTESITDAATSITYLNEMKDTTSFNLYIRYNNVAYKIVVDRQTSKTTDVVAVYTPKAGSMEGQVVSYKAKTTDETAKDWLVLYDNGDTVDITPVELDENWSYTLGKSDPNATGVDNLAKAMNSYENAVSRLNNYCKTIVTNVTSEDNVRSIGTSFNLTDTTGKYSSDFLANNPTNNKGAYNGKGKVGDMNAEQDLVRMSYYSSTTPYTTYGYAKTGSSYWLASRLVNEGSNYAYFLVRHVDDNGNATPLASAFLWSVRSGYADGNSGTYAVRPVARVLKSSL